MSSNSVSLNTNATIQDLAQTIMQEFDVSQNGELTYTEFANFLESFVQSLAGQTAGSQSTTSNTATAAGTTSSLLPTTTSTTSTAYQDDMLGFDFSRMQSAAGTLKYDAASVLQGIDPNDPNAWATAKAALEALHPGAYQFDDANENILLTGGVGNTSDAAAGYIGIRPLDRSNPSGGNAWQWMAYNSSVPGPNGETH
jgi:hypothetical protein